MYKADVMPRYYLYDCIRTEGSDCQILTVPRRCRSSMHHHGQLSRVHCGTAGPAGGRTYPWCSTARARYRRPHAVAKTFDHDAADHRPGDGDGDDVSMTRQAAPLSSSHVAADDDCASRDHTLNAPVNSK